MFVWNNLLIVTWTVASQSKFESYLQLTYVTEWPALLHLLIGRNHKNNRNSCTMSSFSIFNFRSTKVLKLSNMVTRLHMAKQTQFLSICCQHVPTWVSTWTCHVNLWQRFIIWRNIRKSRHQISWLQIQGLKIIS